MGSDWQPSARCIGNPSPSSASAGERGPGTGTGIVLLQNLTARGWQRSSTPSHVCFGATLMRAANVTGGRARQELWPCADRTLEPTSPGTLPAASPAPPLRTSPSRLLMPSSGSWKRVLSFAGVVAQGELGRCIMVRGCATVSGGSGEVSGRRRIFIPKFCICNATSQVEFRRPSASRSTQCGLARRAPISPKDPAGKS